MIGPEAFDFDLPVAQIAQQPAARRGDARLLVLADPGADPPWQHADARDMPSFLHADALVFDNYSKVVPARVHLEGPASRRFELLVCDPRPGLGVGAGFRAWVRGARYLRPGARLHSDEFACIYTGPDPIDPRARVFEVVAGELLPTLQRAGEVPLPPYIRREAGPDAHDADRYQTLYAAAPGSVAAPTAGLHWEPEVLARLDLVRITLHVGPGTFLPMEAADVREHRVGAEQAEISEAAATRIAAARADGRPIVAIGTTATRALEAVAARHGQLVPFTGPVDLVITPGHRFQVVDRLVTNFHLPRSSLLMLVCSLGGHERVLAGYREAVRAGYRFYSYGDCMLV
ncbi:MAG: tRNA preQ1(34) S-adenosylmethionine ribosyltransferase-isomerase QueA [Myxococcales bacterium]|nr:tRNA preQ1(34) S-adenosylmethionine ribosyltransferase-isomerase QueA [Myxococcales bacterium]